MHRRFQAGAFVVAIALLAVGWVAIERASAAPTAWSKMNNGWKVSFLGTTELTRVTASPGSSSGMRLRRTTEAIAGNLDGNPVNNRPALQIEYPSGDRGQPFLGYVLEDVMVGSSVNGGLFLWAQERSGVDLDHDGRTDGAGYFWLGDNDAFRFVRAGNLGVDESTGLNFAVFGEGAGAALLENEATSQIDLDGDGVVDAQTNAVKILLAGGAPGGTVTFRSGVPPMPPTWSPPSIARSQSGVVVGSVFVSTTGLVRLPPTVSGFPNSRVVGGYGNNAYVFDYWRNKMVLDLPGASAVPLSNGITLSYSGAAWQWVRATEVDAGRDVNGDGSISAATTSLCRMELAALTQCYDLMMVNWESLRDGTAMAWVRRPSVLTELNAATIDRAGALTVWNGTGSVLGTGQVLLRTLPTDAYTNPTSSSFRVVTGGVAGNAFSVDGRINEVGSLGDGRFLLNVIEHNSRTASAT
jgi:hypothetical protein